MRKRRLFAIAVILALAGIAAFCIASRRERPKLAIGLIEYHKIPHGGLSARVGVTNVGRSAIEFSPLDNVLLRIQSEAGWKTTNSLPISPSPVFTGIGVILEPGEDRMVTANLPREALYWQIRFSARNPSGQSRLAGKLKPKLHRRLHPALSKLLSNQGALAAEIWSPVFDAKSFRDAHPGELMEVEIPFDTLVPQAKRSVEQRGRARRLGP